jgi:hypothetical protein
MPAMVVISSLRPRRARCATVAASIAAVLLLHASEPASSARSVTPHRTRTIAVAQLLPAGERGWIKTKNREYWRYELELERALKARREQQFV